MSIITTKKTIAILIIAIMFIMLGIPVFAKTTVSTTSKFSAAKTKFDVKEGKTITIYVKENDYNGDIYWFSSNDSYVEVLTGNNKHCSFKGIEAGKKATISIYKDMYKKNKLTSFEINVIGKENNSSNNNLLNFNSLSTGLSGIFKEMNSFTNMFLGITEKVKQINIPEISKKITSLIQGTSNLLSNLFGAISVERDGGDEEKQSTEVEEIKIELNKDELEIYKWEHPKLTAKYGEQVVTPTYSSSRDDIATINDDGTITGKRAGETTITAIYNEKTATCKVIVKEINAEVTVREIGMIKPLKNGRVSSRFGPRTAPTAGASTYHRGIDIVGDTQIKASADGIVSFVKDSSSYGKYLKIDHGNGVETLYAHCDSISVMAGEKVTRGQKIAVAGETGIATGVHLHFEIIIDGTKVNPQNYLYK